MEKIRHPLRTNVGYFLNKPIGFSREFQVDFAEIFIEPDLNATSLVGTFSFSRTREGLLLQADLEADIAANCNRCLEPITVHVCADFEELYVFETRMKEELDEEEVPNDGYIELGVPFRDYLLLGLPLANTCSPDCRGICLDCGQNLNTGTCEHNHGLDYSL